MMNNKQVDRRVWPPGCTLGRALLVICASASLMGCSALGGFKGPVSRVQGVATPDASVSVRPPGGLLYTSVKAPLTTGYEKTQAKAAKQGNATTYSLGVPFFFGGALRVAWGDGGLEEAKHDGGIDDFTYAEYTSTNILSVFTKFTVHAYGD